MMMVQFLLDSDREVSIPGTPQPVSRFIDLVEPVGPAFQQEKRVTAQIHELTRIAREENDFAADQCMQWFIKEQVEEVLSMSDLLTVVPRAKGNVQYIESYAGPRRSDEDHSAPAAAGA